MSEADMLMANFRRLCRYSIRSAGDRDTERGTGGGGDSELGLRALWQIQEQQHHLETLALFALDALHDDTTTVDVDLLLLARRRRRQAHLPSYFRPFVDERIRQERNAFGGQVEDLVENRGFARTLAF